MCVRPASLRSANATRPRHWHAKSLKRSSSSSSLPHPTSGSLPPAQRGTAPVSRRSTTLSQTAWLRPLGSDSSLLSSTALSRSTLVYCDNVSAVYLSTNPVQHQRTKHVEIDLHFVRDRVAIGDVRVLHVPTTSQFADIFTKGLPSSTFTKFRSSHHITGGYLRLWGDRVCASFRDQSVTPLRR